MGLYAKEGSFDRPLISEGVHLGVCIGIFDLGTQFNEHFNKDVHQVLFMWELDEMMTIDNEEKPMAFSKKYTLSLNEKANLRKDLESWRGKTLTQDELSDGFDLQSMLGKSCQIQIVHNVSGEKTYANMASIMSLPKGMSPPTPQNPLKFFTFGEEMPSDTPDWIQKIIKQAKEYGKDLDPAPEKPNIETEEFATDKQVTAIKKLLKSLKWDEVKYLEDLGHKDFYELTTEDAISLIDSLNEAKKITVK